jgi:hypothetical protein
MFERKHREALFINVQFLGCGEKMSAISVVHSLLLNEAAD